ncbi:MAG: DNA replication/repair protein RecF [Anaerovoracaceae bacterium]
MYIREIEINGFRNYEKLTENFDEDVNMFIGDNAQGKTNLLEAIYLTSLGRSFRTSKDKELISFDSEFCRVKGLIIKNEEELVIEIAINSLGKKYVKINGKQIKKMSDLLENVFIVVFSPEDLKIVKDEPEKRRKFIDRELSQLRPSYYNNLTSYKKVLLQRNMYLKGNIIDNNILDVWEEKLSEYGSKVILQRQEFIKKISKISSNIHKSITNEKENLNIIYDANIKVEETLKEQIKKYKKILKNSRGEDIKIRTTRRGPHKDDIKIFSNDIELRNFGSQGQQRTAALSLKLSEIKLAKDETGETPILLLDDVLSELDIGRQNYLIKSFKNTQIFITTTELNETVKNSFPKGKTFLIKSGKVEEK